MSRGRWVAVVVGGGAVDPVHYRRLFASSCDVPCDVLVGSVCQRVIDSIPGETHDVTVALMHVDELVYAIVSHSAQRTAAISFTVFL